MQKVREEYDQWNEKKKGIEFSLEHKKLFPNVWECRWYYEWINVGREQSKTKPFKRLWVVLSTSLWKGLVLIGPLTTKEKLVRTTFVLENSGRFGIKSVGVMLNQCKIIDIKRCVDTHRWSKRFPFVLVDKILDAYISLIKPNKKNYSGE